MGSIPITRSTLFHTIPIEICGFLEFLQLGSEVTQRISRGDNCVICVEICEISRETGLIVIAVSHINLRNAESLEPVYLIP